MIISCRWCETEHEAGADAFCSDDCHQNFNIACQLWGEEAYGAGEVSVWQLHICLARRAHRTQRDFDTKRGKTPETGVRLDGALRGSGAISENRL